MTAYMILCAPGVGGLFLTTAMTMQLKIPIKPKIHATGHAHDMGQGNWQGAGQSVCFIGDYWQLNYREGCRLYYTHVVPQDWRADDVCLIKVTANAEDYRKITELYVKKAWPDIWTKKEYDKWAGPDYPPYSPDNIQDSPIIVQDLVNDFERTITAAWFERHRDQKADIEIDFRTIMGINGQDLADKISAITQQPVSDAVREYIAQYQKTNRDLYFSDV